MQFKNILVPYDGSEQAKHALDVAIKLGEGDKPVKVTALYVAPPTNFDDSAFEVAMQVSGAPLLDEKTKADVRKAYEDKNREMIEDRIEEFFASLPENLTLRIEVGNGAANEVIVEYAEDNSIDLIVMGRRGLGRISAAMGSVSGAVMRATDLPVLVVK